MEIEDKQMPHLAGHENQEGKHVCHRCGWTFPNPHPNAKHRRAHKKHCGQIEGFRLIDDSAVSPSGGAGEENAAAKVFDDDHHKKPEEPASVELKTDEEREKTERTEEAGCGVDEVSRGDRDLCNNDSGVNKTLELHHQPYANEIQGLDVKSVADPLENGIQLGNSSLLCNTAINTITEHEGSSSFTHLEEAALLDFPGEKTHHTSVQNVVATSTITHFTDFGDDAKNSAVMDVRTVLPGDLATEALEIDSASHMMDAHTSASTAGGTASKDMPDETSVKINELDSKASLSQGEQMDAAGQYSQNELFLCTESHPVETNAGENLDASSDAAQIESLTDMGDDCVVKGNVKENLTALSVLSNAPMGEISEMNHRLCKDHEPKKSDISLTYAGAEAGKEQEDHLGGTVLKVVQSEMIPVKSDGTVNIPSTIQLHEETENRSVIGKFNDNQNVNVEHDNTEGSPCVIDVECETDVSISKFNAHDGLDSDWLERDPHATTGESLGAQAIALDASFIGSCEIDESPIQLEVEGGSSFEGQESCHISLGEIMPGDHVLVTNASGGGAVSDAVSQANEATKLLNGSQHIFYEETEIVTRGMVGCSRQEISNEKSCQTDPRVDPEPTSNISESEIPSDDNKGGNELEMLECLMASTVHGSVSGSEGTDIHSGHLEKSGPYFDKFDLQKVLEERAVEPAASNDTDHPVTQTEVHTKYIEMESNLTEQPHGKLDHQKVQIENLQMINGPYSDELDHQKDLQEISTEPAVIDDIDHPVVHTGVQINHIERESNPAEHPHEEPKINESNKFDLCHHDPQKFRLEEHTTPLLDTPASAMTSVTLDNTRTSVISEVVASGTCDQSLQEGAIHIACRQQSDAANMSTDASGDSNSQTDSVEGRWGSVSEREALPVINNLTPKKPHASDLATDGNIAEYNTNAMELFEAPSFMTLVEPAKRPAPASDEIQPRSSPSQSRTNTPRASPAKKKNEEIFEKVVNWDSGKPHTPLKNLLAEASFMAKKGITLQDGGPVATTTVTLGSEIGSDQWSKSSSARTTDHKEWNSPARLPTEKRKVKGKYTWVPFTCCNYIN